MAGKWGLRLYTRETWVWGSPIWQAKLIDILAPAFRYADFTPAELEDCLRSGDMQLWAIHQPMRFPEGAVVTQLKDTVSGKECLILLLAGKGMDRWLYLIGEIEDWAREQGCRAMTVIGRKGWKRVLKDYDETGVIMTKDL